jgi:CubicO group peptidase (beta-lactamase class C family)
MKKLFILIVLPLSVFSQSAKKQVAENILKVENSLAPGIIFGDSIPNWNIEKRMQETGIKGLSIAVIRNYKVEWAKGYGWADVEEKRKVNTETRFQAASISKSLNSMGVLKLVEQGKLDPESDINNYLKSWKFPYDSLSKNKKINTLNLLSHTAGLTIHGFPGYERSDTLPLVSQILDGERPANTKAVRSMFEPGKQLEYSGGGTTITQLMVTDITGREYAEFMQNEVLKPLGMNNSSFNQPPGDTNNLATGYYGNGKPVNGKYHVYPEQAAAGLWTTPSDLAKYIIECQLAYEGKSKKVLSQQMMKKRLTHYIDSSSGLGVSLVYRKGNIYFNHNGGNEAFLCTSFGSMQGGNGVVIMINGEDFSVVRETLNSVARVYNWEGFYDPSFKKLAIVPVDTLKQYEGNYLIMQDTLTIKMVGKDLYIQQNGEPVNGYLLYFSDKISFSLKEQPNANFRILKNTEGRVDALELKQNGATMRLPRVQ